MSQAMANTTRYFIDVYVNDSIFLKLILPRLTFLMPSSLICVPHSWVSGIWMPGTGPHWGEPSSVYLCHVWWERAGQEGSPGCVFYSSPLN